MTPGHLISKLDLRNTGVLSKNQLPPNQMKNSENAGKTTAKLAKPKPHLFTSNTVQTLAPYVLILCAILINYSARAQCNAVVLNNTGEIDDVGKLANSACSLLVCPGTLVKTLGYNNPGDHGAAEYRIEEFTSPPPSPGPRQGIDFKICDDGTVERWAMFQFDGTIRAEQAGLVGDGTTNDYPALVRLTFYLKRHYDVDLDLVNVAEAEGGLIKFSADRTYKMDIDNSTHGKAIITNNMTIDGEGAVLDVGEYSTTQLLFHEAGSASSFERLVIKNLTIKGDATTYNDAERNCYKTSNVWAFSSAGLINNVFVENVTFKNLRVAVDVSGTGATEHRYSNCIYVNIPDAIETTGVKNAFVSNCSFSLDRALIDDNNSAPADLYHHMYIWDALDLKIENCVFKGHFGTCLNLKYNDPAEVGVLHLSNIEMEDAGRLNLYSGKNMINNISCKSAQDFLHLHRNGHTEISNLDYEYTGSGTNGFIAYTGTSVGKDNTLSISNSSIKGAMRWGMGGFNQLNVGNSTFIDPVDLSGATFYTVNTQLPLGKASFNNVHVLINDIHNPLGLTGNYQLFRLESTLKGQLQFTNSTIENTSTTAVQFLAQTGQETVLLENIGYKGFEHFCVSGNDASNLRVNNVYELTTNQPHPNLHLSFPHTFTKPLYIEKVVECTSSSAQSLNLNDDLANGYEVTVINSDVSSTITVGTTGSGLIDGLATFSWPSPAPHSITFTKSGGNWYSN